MESGAAGMIERVTGWLIPPASREEVLGDLHERSANLREFVTEAARVIPFVIYSRIRRTTDSVVLLMNAGVLYTAFVLTARVIDARLLAEEATYAKLAVPVLIVLAALVLADAYNDPKKRWPLKPLFAPMLGIAIAFAWESSLGTWALPHAAISWGGVTGAVLVSTLRLLFPPVTERPQANVPAYWQKLEPAALRARDFLAPAVIVAAIVVYLSLSKN